VPRTREFWNWKHVANPFGPSYALAAEADGRLVGLRLFLRWRFRCDGREIPAVRAVDTVTHPDWRGRGIFSRLTRELLERVEEDGVALVFNTPNAASRAGYLKMGWCDVGRVPVLVRPLRPLRMLFGSQDEARSRRRPTEAEEGDRVATAPGTVPVDELLDSEAAGTLTLDGDGEAGRLETARSPAFLRWRYAAVPGIEYRAAWRSAAGDVAATIVRGRIRRGRRELSLSEVLASGSRGSARLLAELLAELGEQVKRDADYLVATASRQTRRHRILRRGGFRTLPTATPRLTVRPLAATSPEPTLWSSWSLSTGDLELF
jgi:GNAT superfamily N-acetyltransferase